MAKKAQYYEEAEKMYVIQQMTIDEIHRALKIATKTISNWKAEVKDTEKDWDAQRAALLRKQKNVSAMIYDILALVTESVKKDLEEGSAVDATRLNFIRTMAPNLKRTKEYEKEIVPDDEAKEKVQLTEDELAQARKELGL